MAKKVIIDTDTGIDDAMGCALAMRSPELEILGFTSVFGNVEVELVTENTAYLMEQLGCEHIPLAMGSGKGLVGEPVFVPEVHGADGVGDANFPKAEKVRPVANSAADFIVEMSNEHPGEITIIGLGPLTNVALAMRLDPTLPERIPGIAWMGGAVYAPGNITATAEFDAWGDPEAAQMVLQAPWQVQMVSLDVTDVPVFFESDLEMLAAADTAASKYMATVMPFYMQFYQDRYGEYSCAAHSALTVAIVAQPEIVTATESLKIQVEVEGTMTRGMTVADRRPVGGKGDDPGWETTPRTELPRTVDLEKFRDLFLARMCEVR